MYKGLQFRLDFLGDLGFKFNKPRGLATLIMYFTL